MVVPPKPSGVITILTDFGWKDPYVGVMKGVILSINPKANIVDITHDISKFNIFEACLTVKAYYKYFPRGTVHLIVVDPGVGGKRRPILVVTQNYFFVAPDNGVLSLVLEEEKEYEAYEISSAKYTLPRKSYTFHGRDIFSPAAAYVSLGVPPAEFGPKLSEIIRLDFPKEVVGEREIVGQVVYIDSFGNIVTNISSSTLFNVLGVKYGEKLEVSIGDRTLKLPFTPYYASVPRGSLLALINSFDVLEIAVNQGSAAEVLGVRAGEKVRVRRCEL